MWVFGFGSLMWGNWQDKFDCSSKSKANLFGYRRRFNKASVRNWGTKDIPGPTLNVEKSNGSSCYGIAFEFPQEKTKEVLDYLQDREGKKFALVECEVRLENGKNVEAHVPIYQGKNILDMSTEELAALACKAVGEDGKCLDYVLNIAKRLIDLGIEDEEVSQLAIILKQKNHSQ